VDHTHIRHLVARLAAAVNRPLFTPLDWADWLDHDSTSQAFAQQLQAEWLLVTPPDDFCEALAGRVRDHLLQHAGGLPIWAHTLRVTGHALALAPQAHVEPALAFALGLLHDIGKLDEGVQGAPHEELGARFAAHVLSAAYSPAVVTLLANVIAKRASRINPFARLLRDADRLDKIGAAGIARRLSSEFGSRNISAALGRVSREIEKTFTMHFPFSQQMAATKREFTQSFLNALAMDKPSTP
jgi:HD superfamily phosphodiesterase